MKCKRHEWMFTHVDASNPNNPNYCYVCINCNAIGRLNKSGNKIYKVTENGLEENPRAVRRGKDFG